MREQPIISTENFTARQIIHRMLHQCNRRESSIRAHTKPPQSCEERKPAPPNEEQFNAPTTGSHAMNPIAAVLTSRSNSRKVHGSPRTK